jgi:hypothetical protein
MSDDDTQEPVDQSMHSGYAGDVDLERLADFVGGALDGTPEADAVRHLIETDPGWRSAHTDLAAAMVTVHADLAALGAGPAPVPPDVAARLDEMLRRPRGTSQDEPEQASGPAVDGRRPSGGRHASDGRRPSGGTGPGRDGGQRPARAGMRRLRALTGLSAAAVVIVVGFGLLLALPQLNSKQVNQNSAPGSAQQQDSAGGAAQPNEPGVQTAVVLLASGRDYQPNGFGSLATPTAQAPAAPGANSDTQTVEGKGLSRESAGSPPELARLLDPVARNACLAAITAKHGGVAQTVDYAHFNQSPALIVVLNGSRTGGGAQWIVVVGPNCGQPAGLIDELYNGRLR